MKLTKKLFCMLLCCMLLIGLLPVTALAAEEVTSITIYGVKAPVIGEMPTQIEEVFCDIDGVNIMPGGDADNLLWAAQESDGTEDEWHFDYSDTSENVTTTPFREGYRYMFFINMFFPEDKLVNEDTTVSFYNLEGGTIYERYTVCEWVELTFDKAEKAKKSITSVTLTGTQKPIVGSKLSVKNISLGSKVVLDSDMIFWVKWDDELGHYIDEFDDTAPVKEGEKYALQIVAYPADGYKFADDIKISYNGTILPLNIDSGDVNEAFVSSDELAIYLYGDKMTRTSINDLKVSLSKTLYTYDGKVKKPTVTVKDANGNKVSSANYTVSYASGRKVPGTYTVKVTMKGSYKGTKTLTFRIRGKQMAISKLTALSKGFKATWAKQSYVTGYQLQYSTSSKFTSSTTKTVKMTKNTTVSKSVTKLKAAKKYYVRIRSYKTTKISGKTYTVYSVWSKAKYVTTKK